MAATKKKYTGPVLVALVALLLPLLVSLKNTEKPNLTGLVISDEKPEWSWSAWFNGDYQKLRDDYNNDHWGWKEIMVRANNQLYYQAFNQIRVNKFVIGKDDYIFSENYIHAAFGDDLVDEAKVAELMRKAKVVQDTLKKKGIDLFCVFAQERHPIAWIKLKTNTCTLLNEPTTIILFHIVLKTKSTR